MKNLVLIDGNSLLNRAYYGMRPLTTRDGTPTNAVFGFIKLLLKLLSDIHPEGLIVAFDLKAPTFRHKMYESYKATRKPMPEDLVVQVNILKELLRSMRFTICEKEGYEADDLIGTLSHRFADTKSIIITGDRDAYQLVDECTDVYFTKTGVSELLKLNWENFEAIVGYAPAQVIDMKALMGDASDNIPGVPGVGEKTARSLIQRFGNLDGVYTHIDETAPSVQKKLEAGRESAYLSRTLATIDRNVPLDLPEDAGEIYMPFSEEVRTQFLRLEFTSFLKLDLFEKGEPAQQKQQEIFAELVTVSETEKFLSVMSEAKIFAVARVHDGIHVYSDGKEYIVRMRHTLLDDGLSDEDFNCALSGLFSNPSQTAILYGKKAFWHMLRSHGAELLTKAEDVSLMKYLIDYSGRDDNLAFALQSEGLSETHPAYGIFRMFGSFSEKLKEQGMESLYRDVELPLSDVLFEMEEDGVMIDTAMSEQFEKRYREQIAAITERIYRLAGETFNLNSPMQLGKILFEKLGIPAPKKSKRGTYSTSADVLEKLQDDYEIVRDVLHCRHLQKLLSTYIDGFKPLIDPNTHLVHTTYNQVQTSTGRLSSLNPNLQNIPVRDEEGRELRKLFIARDKGRILIDADYSQIELRLLAHFSGCKELIEAYREGQDIHALTASQVFEVPLGAVTPAQRREAKAVNFGIIYGISDFGLAANLHISTKQAGEYIRRYFERYSDVKKYMDENVAFARKNGYVTTLLGRKRMIAEIRSSNYNVRSFGERAAMNMPLQGSSADIIKLAMIRIADRLHQGRFRSQLILQVHDELVIDAWMDEQEEVANILKMEMEHAVELAVPLVAEVHCGRNWYEAK